MIYILKGFYHEQNIIKDSCLALQIPFEARAVNVRGLVAQGKNSLEEAARILRYGALEEKTLYRLLTGQDSLFQ